MAKIYPAILAFTLALSLVIVLAWLWYERQISAPIVQNNTLLEIAPGDNINSVIASLKKNGIAVNAWCFKLLGSSQNANRFLKIGEYELQDGMNMQQILQVFARGKTKQHAVTFPEGWTFGQILERLAQHPQIKQTLRGDNADIMGKIAPTYSHPEGLFFPDTYFFAKGTPDFTLLKIAYRKMQIVLAELWAKRAPDLPLQNPYQALILASIVEKETAQATERQQIAGVFSRRLQKGMLLQADPTVIYGIGAHYRGNISKQHLKAPNPYNTYTKRGLPPTPIAMPGAAAIYAVLHPDAGKSLYFVAKNQGEGRHIFSATLREHNDAVRRYQK